jgi:hypothetical protein
MGLLLLFLFDGRAALEVATRWTDTVRQHRFITLAAILDLPRLNVMMASPVALPGTGNPSLRNSHIGSP